MLFGVRPSDLSRPGHQDLGPWRDLEVRAPIMCGLGFAVPWASCTDAQVGLSRSATSEPEGRDCHCPFLG